MLERWRRRALVAVVVYVVALLAWALRPWTDTQLLVTPEGAPPVAVDYRCPPTLIRGDPPEAQDPVPYPPADTPCAQRRSLQVLTGFNLLVAGAALAVLWRAGRRRSFLGEPLSSAGASPR